MNKAVNFSTLPRRIRVGSIFFNLTVTNHNDSPENPMLGMTNGTETRIIIRLTGNDSQDLNTVHHEILHALYYSHDIQNSPDLTGDEETRYEEAVVNGLTNSWLALLYDNPAFFEWYVESVRAVGEMPGPVTTPFTSDGVLNGLDDMKFAVRQDYGEANPANLSDDLVGGKYVGS